MINLINALNAFRVEKIKYLGMYINKRKEAQSKSCALYAATNRCCSGPSFRTQMCPENTRTSVFKTYIHGSLYCLSCLESMTQPMKNAYRFALFKFFGNLPHINTRNINNSNTRTSTLTVNAAVMSLGELHRKSCFSLYERMKSTVNTIANDYVDFCLYTCLFAVV